MCSQRQRRRCNHDGTAKRYTHGPFPLLRRFCFTSSLIILPPPLFSTATCSVDGVIKAVAQFQDKDQVHTETEAAAAANLSQVETIASSQPEVKIATRPPIQTESLIEADAQMPVSFQRENLLPASHAPLQSPIDVPGASTRDSDAKENTTCTSADGVSTNVKTNGVASHNVDDASTMVLQRGTHAPSFSMSMSVFFFSFFRLLLVPLLLFLPSFLTLPSLHAPGRCRGEKGCNPMST